MCSSHGVGESGVWATLPGLMTNEEKVTKAEFVWLMVQLAEADRAKYRELRKKGWAVVAQAGSIRSESAIPN